MKTLFTQTIKNRLPLFLITASVSLIGMAAWFYLQSSANDSQLSSAYQDSVWNTAIISILAVFLAACLTKIYVLRKAHKKLLTDYAKRQQTEETLNESDARYRIVTESAADAVLTFDEDNTILFVNPAAEKIFGYTVAEMLGKKLFMLIPESLPGVNAAELELNNETNKRNTPWRGVELPALHKAGYEVPIEVTFGEINSEGKHLFTAIIRDITERKRAKEELRQNFSLLTSTFEATADGILVVNLSNDIVTFNKKFVEMWGIPEDISERKNSTQIIAWVSEQLEDPDQLIKKAKQSLEQPEIKDFSILELADGRIYERLSYPQMLDGKAVGRVLSFRDITERKHAEEAHRQSGEKYRNILETMQEGYYELDLRGNLVFCNEMLCEFSGYGKEELEGIKYKQFIDKKDAKRLFVAFQNVFTTGNPVDAIQWQMLCRNGTRRYAELSITLGRNELNEPVCFRGIIRDVTERKRAEIESQVISEIIQGVTTTSNLDEFLALVQQTIGQAINAENFYVALYDKQSELLHIPFCKDKYDAVSPPQKLGKGLTAYVFRHGRPTLLTKKAIYQLNEQGEIELVGTPPAIWLGIPLRTPTEIIGVLVVQHYEDDRAYTERDIELLSSAASQIGLAIQRRRAEDTLRESEANLAAAQRITHLGSWELDLADLEDLKNNEVRWSDETYHIFGYVPGQVEASYELFYNSVHPDDRKLVAEVLAEAIEQRKVFTIEHRVILPDTSERILHEQAELIFDKHTGMPLKLLGTVQDITERRRTDAALRYSEYKLRTLFASMSEGLTQVDNNEAIEFVNDRLCEMTGYEREELLGETTLDIFFDDEGRRIVNKENKRRQKGISGQYEARLRKKSGEMLWVLVSGAPIINDEGILTGTLGMFMDISERKRAEEQLLHDAFHDGLTGLANRALFMDHLRMTIERGKSRHSNFYAVLFLDFDRFKVINDSLGHAEGDELLKQIARRLELSTRTGDLVARLGGDEFVILLSEMLEVNDAIQVAERIQDDLKDPFDIRGSEVFISASIGIALSTNGNRRAEGMLRDADIAMYRAKANGKARYQVFNQAMRVQATTRLQLETEMRAAIERREFELHYQPIINLETNELNGFEALVRWRHPTRGIIPPDDFIPSAEETGLILPLGRWILGESCRQMREWQNAYPHASSLIVSVNLSCKQFLQSDLAEQVAETLNATGLPSRCLKLEITESYLIENSEKAVKVMNRLRAIGVELSLDDFGTGYSSLSYLHRLPVSSLKIDRSFISRMTENEENNEIVRTIVKLAQNLKMQVIAEGIETVEQLAQLQSLKCGYGQGYLFSKPLEAETAAVFISENLGNLSGLTEQPVITLELNM